jgi:hypothetical protein
MSGAQYRDLPKHKRYNGSYRRFDYYWGLGIEHETYFKTSQKKEIQSFEGILKPERYSVSYYAVYKSDTLQKVLADVIKTNGGTLQVPVLANSHTFTHVDLYGAHKTTYEKVPKPNPQYSGKTFFEWICEKSKWIQEKFNHSFVWDGDTIEIITQNFYKATVKDVMAEIRQSTLQLEQEMKRLPKQGILTGYGPLQLATPVNEPWAFYLTNPRNVAMFNNGTLHINVTLPTRLGWNRKPLCWKSFVKKHERLARLIQWIEPMLIAVYGSGDPLATVSERYARGSQRVAVSRYIGLGTFDTETMVAGKILQIPRGRLPWYDWLYERTDYVQLDKIGLDLNFNKHGAHGLELRFFDQMSYDNLEEVMKMLVLVMDCSLTMKQVENPVKNVDWISSAGQALLYGPGWQVSVSQLEAVFQTFQIYDVIHKEPLYVTDALQKLFQHLNSRRGECYKLMIGS